MSDYPMLISNKLHSFRNFIAAKIQIIGYKRSLKAKKGLSRIMLVWMEYHLVD